MISHNFFISCELLELRVEHAEEPEVELAVVLDELSAAAFSSAASLKQ